MDREPAFLDQPAHDEATFRHEEAMRLEPLHVAHVRVGGDPWIVETIDDLDAAPMRRAGPSRRIHCVAHRGRQAGAMLRFVLNMFFGSHFAFTVASL